MNLPELIANGSIAYIELIHDRVPNDLRGPFDSEYCRWYVVHIEPAQQDRVQTVSCTVTYGELEAFLTSMGWTYEIDQIRHVYQNQ